jgi:hypothetical protein
MQPAALHSDGSWSVCVGAGAFWQMAVPLLLLTGAGAVMAASFSPLVEARYVMPELNTPVGLCTLNSSNPPPPRLIGWNMCRPMRRLNDVCVGQ